MTDPVRSAVPWYRDGRYIFAIVCFVGASALLIAEYITDIQWLDFAKSLVGAVLGGAA